MIPTASALHRELWTSWASTLRAYAALHGLSSLHHAVVEVGADEIILRVDNQWLRFTPTAMHSSRSPTVPFALLENGDVLLDAMTEPMDLAAEHLARTLLHPA